MDASIILIALSFLLMVFLTVSVAASNARKRKVKCRELAEHATIVNKIIRHADVPEALTAMAEMRGVVGALKEVLEEALELVDSCCKGCRFRLCRAADVDKFDDVGKKLDHRLQSLLLLLQVESMAKFSMVKTGDKHYRVEEKPREKGDNDKRPREKGGDHKQMSSPDAEEIIAYLELHTKEEGNGTSKNNSHMQYRPPARGMNQCAAMDACVVNVNPTVQMATTSTGGYSNFGN